MRVEVVWTLFVLSTSASLIFVTGTGTTGRSDGSSVGVTVPPWQSPTSATNENILEVSQYEDKPPIIFSPTGRLHPVENALKISKSVKPPVTNLVLAMRCRDGILIVSTVTTSPYLDDDDDDNSTSNTTTSTSSGSIIPNCKTQESINNNLQSSSSSSSLFLFEETCLTTTTGPIFDVHHSCIVAATAGNAVDRKIMRSKLFAVALNAVESQQRSGAHHYVDEGNKNDVYYNINDNVIYQVARDLANQLQATTQEVGSDRILASSAVVLGGENQKIFRIDPTGQFYDMACCVLGEDADMAEEELYRRLVEHDNNNITDERNKAKAEDSSTPRSTGGSNKNVHQILGSISHDEALVLAIDFLKSRKSTRIQNEIPTKKTNTNNISSSRVYWQAEILDYSPQRRQRRWKKPRRISRRGAFISS